MKRRRLTLFYITFAFALAGAVVTAETATADEAMDDRRALYDQAMAASVEVLANGHLEASGWFADDEGYVVTVAHLLGNSDQVLEVRSKTLGRMPAAVVAVDYGHDLALLKAELPKKSVVNPLKIADSQPGPGADVFLFGAALFRHWVMLRGMVARDQPTYEYYPNLGHYSRILHVSAPSPAGTSGGCWLDANGKVVGGQSAMMTSGGGGSGIAFMSPAAPIRRLVKTRKSAVTATIGAAIEELCEQAPKHIRRFPDGAEGVLAVKSAEGSPANLAGLSRQTLIQAVNGQAVRYRHEFLDAVRAHSPGDEITLGVYAADADAATTVTVKLAQIKAGR